MSAYIKVKTWRKKCKQIILHSMGLKCQICQYDKCHAALELHHVNPEDKEYDFSSTARSWDKVFSELEKCILLCANCHREIHAGVAVIPETYQKFNKKLAEKMRDANNTESKSNAAKNKAAKALTRNQLIKEEKINCIMNSGVDFSTKNWSTRLGTILGMSSQQTSQWIRCNMKEFYYSESVYKW